MTRLVLVGAFVLAFVSPAHAAPEDVANDIAGEVMSPYCPGVTLHDCPSDAAIALRDRIEEWARQGWSRGRIMTTLEAEFGADIRARPPTSGRGLLAWLLPGLAVAGGLAVAWLVARRWSKGREESSAGPAGSASERAQIEAELAALRGGPQ
jgi:cytochrome c-type biogenesis protein CcmH